MKSAPKAPDAKKTAAIQDQYNQKAEQRALAYNRVDQLDPFGNSLNWIQTGTDAKGNPTFGAAQGLGQLGMGYAGGLAGLGGQYFDMAKNYLQQPFDLNSQGAFDQAYGYATANLEPRFEQSRAAAENRLRNQGLDPTSEAYRSQMNDLALQQNEARNNLVTGLQGQLFNQGLQGRQQQIGELAQLASPGISFGNNVLNPSYAQVPGVGTSAPDYQGARMQQYQGDLNSYNNSMAGLGGLAKIGTSLALAPMSGGGSLVGSFF